MSLGTCKPVHVYEFFQSLFAAVFIQVYHFNLACVSWAFSHYPLAPTWLIRDFGSAEWFHSLLHAIEEQNTQGWIEINTYLTGKINEDEMNNVIVRTFFFIIASFWPPGDWFSFYYYYFKVQDVSGEKDAITFLRAPTHYGKPNQDRWFPSIVKKHAETD